MALLDLGPIATNKPRLACTAWAMPYVTKEDDRDENAHGDHGSRVRVIDGALLYFMVLDAQCSAPLLLHIGSVGFFSSRVEADQAGNHDRKEELPADPFDDGKAARHIAARHDISIAEGCQRNETKVDRAHTREIAGHIKGAGPDLLEHPIEVAEKDPREQVGAERPI